MNLDHLREFVFLADSLNFSETARHFYESQSVLSKHIAAMEEELQVKLFNRSSHGVTLTFYGEAFKKDAMDIVKKYDSAVLSLLAAKKGYSATVYVCYLRGASQRVLPLFLRTMHQKHPDIHVSLQCIEFFQMEHFLETKTTDIVIAMDFFPELHQDYEVIELYRDRFDVIAAKGHPLCEHVVEGKLSLSALKGYPLLLPERKAYGPMAAFFQGFLPPDIRDGNVEFYRDIDSAVARTFDGFVGFSSEHNKVIYDSIIDFFPLSDVDTGYPVSAFVSREGAKERELECCAEVLREVRRQIEKQDWEK